MSSNDIASEDCFKINFFNIDSYVTKPQLNFDATYSDYRKANINLATVVRVFGSTDSGIKACIHIHQHCPHLSLRQKDVATAYGIILDDENAELDPKILNAFIQDVENDLVKYIDSNKNKENIFIVNIEKYYACSFYGYHEEPELFYKVYFNSFWMANQAKNSLEAGSINNFKFVCHNFLEFLLQFYIDHRIYLNVLRFKKISFRKPYEHDLGFNSGIFQSIQKQKRQSLKNVIHYNDLPFSSTCTLECDAFVDDIILIERRKTFPPNHVFNPTMPGIIELWNNQYHRSPEKFENLLKVLRIPDWKQYEQTCPYDRMKKKFVIPDNDTRIPQLDGPNEWEPNEAQKLSCIFRKKCIEIDPKKFKNGVVVCRKIDGVKISSKSVPLVVKNSRFCIEEMTKENFFKSIEKKIKPFHQSKLYLQRLKQELKSYRLKNVKIAHQLTMVKSSDNRLKLCFSNQIPAPISTSDQAISKKKSKQIPIPMLDESNFFKQSIPFNQIPQKLLNISVVNDKTSNHSSFLDHKNETFDQLEDMFEWSQCLSMTVMSLELHARIRQNLTPDPNYDPIQMVIFAVYEEFLKDVQSQHSMSKSKKKKSNILYMGAIIVHPTNLNGGSERIILDDKNLSIDFVQAEQDLITKLAFYVGNFDPDIILGYIIDTYSWGYLLQRASNLGIEIGPLFSRITNPYQVKRNFPGELDKSPQLIGRIVLNTWRLLRHEFNLRCYTFENVHHHLFRLRFPKFPNDLLRSLWQKFTLKQNEFSKHLIIGYYLDRVLGSLRILSHLNFIRRTFNLSCLFGMQFQDVINRGTQFQVESMLFPLCLSKNLLPIRFGQDFIKTQKAAQATPLIFEPRVAYHQEPVAVFDFQSLYPSIVIAYNYCYSTCLGRLQNVLGKDDLFGCYQYRCDRTILKRFSDNVHISPNDVLFVKSNVRRGLLPRMLEEILNTRILVKKELKDVNCKLSSKGGDLTPEQRKKLRALKRQLEISQLGLKMIANVTYGYTNANFSGRMPCVEIADAIVSKGRQTLEEVIVFINNWGKRSGTSAKVIYGDTDSVFVSFPNTSVENAFEMANFILKEINDRQTYPICLKLEKVYKPCIILAKKRYCGFAYDSSSAEAFFDAKGIETVRRDTCNMTAKIMEKCIRILSQSNGLIDSLKSYLQWEFKKILMGRLSRLEDFVFAREFGGFHNYCNESIIPACIIARKRMQLDPRDQPKFKERVPYVIVDCGETKPTRLADLVREPMDLLKDESLKLNASYYINHVIIPPLVRVLDSVHNDGMSILLSWYEQVKNSHKCNLNLITFKHLKKLSSIKSSLPMDVHWHTSRKRVSIVNIIKYCKTSTIILDSLRIIGRKLKHFEKNCSLCCRADIRTLVSLNQCCSVAGQHQCLVDNCSVLFNYRQAQKDFHCLFFWDQALMLKLLNPNHCPDQ